MTVPLLVTASGQKMGKTLSGAAWLAPERLTPDGFYQFWVNCEDGDVGRFLRIYTLLPLEQLEALRLEGAEAIKHAKHILAFEVTALIHGQRAAETAHAAAQAGFGAEAIPASMLPASAIPRGAHDSFQALPTLILTEQQLADGILVTAVLVTLGWAKSNNEARRLVVQGGVRLAERVVDDPQALVTRALLEGPEGLLIRAGKRRLHRLVGPVAGGR